jgi:uncharacterized protein YjbI with pentapeptide repeats
MEHRRGANLTGANLKGANLSKALLYKAYLKARCDRMAGIDSDQGN